MTSICSLSTTSVVLTAGRLRLTRVVELGGGVNTGPWAEAVQQITPPAPDFERRAWIIVIRIGPLVEPVLTRAEVTRQFPGGVCAVAASKNAQLGGGISNAPQPAAKAGVWFRFAPTVTAPARGAKAREATAATSAISETRTRRRCRRRAVAGSIVLNVTVGYPGCFVSGPGLPGPLSLSRAAVRVGRTALPEP